jgi:hypothetical protein
MVVAITVTGSAASNVRAYRCIGSSSISDRAQQWHLVCRLHASARVDSHKLLDLVAVLPQQLGSELLANSRHPRCDIRGQSIAILLSSIFVIFISSPRGVVLSSIAPGALEEPHGELIVRFQ